MFVHGHYDGYQVQLDEPVHLKPNTKVRIEIPDDEPTFQEERREWMNFALANFARPYEDETDIYTDDMIIKRNPHYRGNI